MSGLMNMLIGKKLSPEEQVKKWRQSIRTQERELDKQLRGIESEEIKVKRNIKQAAKRNDVASCKLLAREVVRSRKAKDRLHTSKAQLNSLVMQLQNQLAAAKVTGTLKKSTEVMKLVNGLVKLPEINMIMPGNAGIISEMMDDAIDTMDDEGIEEEADAEVDKVLGELTDGLLTGAGPVGASLEVEEPAVEEEEPELDAMQARLSALRGSVNPLLARISQTVLL
ncbi:Snf7-domain-containing protein [Chytridium lagenaria]|nr:Snf7-domain-containing protein [Chytridium lagenaria]